MTPKHELARLIDATTEANRWSLADVSARAKGRGHALSQQNLSRIRTEPVVTLVAKQVRALAAGLDLPVSVVVDATLRSMGFPTTDQITVTPEDAVQRDERLGTRDRRILTAVLNELRRGQEGDDRGDAASMNQADDRSQRGAASVVPLRRSADVSDVDRTLAASEGDEITAEFESHEDQP